MTAGNKELIRYKLGRARDTLDEAAAMIQAGHPYGAANRIYYACFYAVTALLLTQNLSSSKHSGVHALFNRHFVKTGMVPVSMGKFYARILDSRIESDYADLAEIEIRDAKESLSEAQDFLNFNYCSHQ